MALQVIEFNGSFKRLVSQRVPLLARPAVFLKHALLDEPAVAPNQQPPSGDRQTENDLTLGMCCKAIMETLH
jgi:hypothetical protein